jgi:hypothetical protein
MDPMDFFGVRISVRLSESMRVNEMNENTSLPQDFNGLLTALAGGEKKYANLAVDLGQSYWKVYRWTRSNYVPEKAWADVMRLSEQRGLKGVNAEYLHKLGLKGRVIAEPGKYRRNSKKLQKDIA